MRAKNRARPRGLAAGIALALGALTSAGAPADEGAPLVVMELFTSQSCYSCPPAEELLAEHYLNRDDVLPLEMHVDYWDDLIYGFSGKWKDIWSDPAYTQRQYDYNLKIRGSGSVYTPQFVIAGAYEAAGTRQGRIDSIIDDVRSNPSMRRHRIEVRPDGQGGSVAKVAGEVAGGEVFAVIYQRRSVTEIGGGENDGKTLVNHNVVKEILRLEPVAGEYRIGPVDPETEGCAFILQDAPVGVIRAAARCAAGGA